MTQFGIYFFGELLLNGLQNRSKKVQWRTVSSSSNVRAFRKLRWRSKGIHIGVAGFEWVGLNAKRGEEDTPRMGGMYPRQDRSMNVNAQVRT